MCVLYIYTKSYVCSVVCCLPTAVARARLRVVVALRCVCVELLLFCLVVSCVRLRVAMALATMSSNGTVAFRRCALSCARRGIDARRVALESQPR